MRHEAALVEAIYVDLDYYIDELGFSKLYFSNLPGVVQFGHTYVVVNVPNSKSRLTVSAWGEQQRLRSSTCTWYFSLLYLLSEDAQ
jgi:hypothetical protein